jgi:hypothetical protein
VKVKTYHIITEAIENGVRCGYRRAYKHTDTPNEEHMIASVYEAVMLALDDVVRWEDQEI